MRVKKRILLSVVESQSSMINPIVTMIPHAAAPCSPCESSISTPWCPVALTLITTDIQHSRVEVKISSGLNDLGWGNLELGVEDTVPEFARDAEPVLVIRKVMLEMVFLELSVVGGQTVAH